MRTGDEVDTAERGSAALIELVRKHGLLFGFLLVLVLGTLAFEAARTPGEEGLPILASLYLSLRMFVFEFAMPGGAADNLALSWLLTILSYAAVIISSSAVIGFFAQRLSAPLRLKLQALQHNSSHWPSAGRGPRKRAVLLGFGKINRAVAQTLTARGYSITAIDERFDEPAQLIARNNLVLLVPGDLSDSASLRRAFMGAADMVIVAAGNDVTNIEVAAAAHKLAPQANVFAHVASPGFSDALRESMDTGFALAEGIRTFSVKEESARNLLRRAHLAREARERGQQSVHLVIVGMGDQGEAILIEALQSAMAIDLGPPHITLIDKNAATLEIGFKARRPGLYERSLPTEARPCISFLPTDIETVDFADEDWPGSVPVTAYVFCCGEDATNLAAGLRLEHSMNLGRRAPAPIFLTVWGAGIDLELHDNRDPLGHCVLFGAVEPTIAGAAFLKGDPDLLASRLHDAYERQRCGAAGPDEKPRPWSGMPQTMKEANRRAVRHAHVKLIDMDLHWRGMGAADLPTIAADIAPTLNTVRSDIDSPAILDGRLKASLPERLMAELAETEHRRWLVDRALDGWRCSQDGTRDNAARTHPNILPFRNLRPDDQHYDTVLVRALVEEFGRLLGSTETAYAAKRSCLVVAADGTTAGTIQPGTTELIVAFPSQRYRIAHSPPVEFARAIKAWSETARACRVRVVLGQRFSSGVPHSEAAINAEGLRALVRSVPVHLDMSIVHLYGTNARPAPTLTGLDEYLARALVDRHASIANESVSH